MSNTPQSPYEMGSTPGPGTTANDEIKSRNTRLWFRVYCGFMALVYLLCTLGGIGAIVLSMTGQINNNDDRIMLIIQGIIFSVISVPLMIMFAFGLNLPRRKWGWIFGIVLIAIGLTSPCCMPASIPLLIFWMKPELRRFYNA